MPEYLLVGRNHRVKRERTKQNHRRLRLVKFIFPLHLSAMLLAETGTGKIVILGICAFIMAIEVDVRTSSIATTLCHANAHFFFA